VDGGFLGWNHVATDGQFSAGACWTIGMSRVSWLDTITWLQVCTCSIAVAATRPPSRWGHSYRQPTTELENGSDPCEDVLAYIGLYWHWMEQTNSSADPEVSTLALYSMFDLQVKSISSAMASCLQEFYKTRPASEGGALDYLQYQFSLPRCWY